MNRLDYLRIRHRPYHSIVMNRSGMRRRFPGRNTCHHLNHSIDLHRRGTCLRLFRLDCHRIRHRQYRSTGFHRLGMRPQHCFHIHHHQYRTILKNHLGIDQLENRLDCLRTRLRQSQSFGFHRTGSHLSCHQHHRRQHRTIRLNCLGRGQRLNRLDYLRIRHRPYRSTVMSRSGMRHRFLDRNTCHHQNRSIGQHRLDSRQRLFRLDCLRSRQHLYRSIVYHRLGMRRQRCFRIRPRQYRTILKNHLGIDQLSSR